MTGALNAALLKCSTCDGDAGLILNGDDLTYRRRCAACSRWYPGKAKHLKTAKCPDCRAPLTGETVPVRAWDTLHGGECLPCKTRRVFKAGGVAVFCGECTRTFVVPVAHAKFHKVLGLPIDFDQPPRTLRAASCKVHTTLGIKP